MQINIIQAVMIGILSYLGSLSCPWALGLTGGWYTLSRPLISGFLIGLIMGNAAAAVKKTADFITKTNDEEGVAWALDRFLGGL